MRGELLIRCTRCNKPFYWGDAIYSLHIIKKEADDQLWYCEECGKEMIKNDAIRRLC